MTATSYSDVINRVHSYSSHIRTKYFRDPGPFIVVCQTAGMVRVKVIKNSHHKNRKKMMDEKSVKFEVLSCFIWHQKMARYFYLKFKNRSSTADFVVVKIII